jgi:putative transposase
VQGLTLFETPADYRLLDQLLADAVRRFPVLLLAFCIMPNHWHLVVLPLEDGALSLCMKWLTATHAQRWRRSRGNQGRGAVYQGRFKAIAVQHDRYFLTLCRYVERNPARARLVGRCEDWRWSSAAVSPGEQERPALSAWPITKPADWLERLNTPEAPRSLECVRAAVRLGRHLGSPSWRLSTAAKLRWRNGLRQRGRPAGAVPLDDELSTTTES